MSVSEIVEHLDGNQPNISKHLQILFDAGLVGRERSGNSILYRIADPVVFKLCQLVCRSTARHAAEARNALAFWKSPMRRRGLKIGSTRGVN